MIRANRKTAIAAGFVTVISIEIIRAMKLSNVWIALPFYGSVLFGVIGIPQMKETRAVRKQRGSYLLLEPGDMTKYYFPVWIRMFLWFVGGAITSAVMQVAGISGG